MRALRLLRRHDRLDELAELLGVLLQTSARLVDAATGETSDVAGYARAQIIRAHGALIGQMAQLVGTVEEEGWLETFINESALPRHTEDRWE
jgi:hypothetical protein